MSRNEGPKTKDCVYWEYEQYITPSASTVVPAVLTSVMLASTRNTRRISSRKYFTLLLRRYWEHSYCE